MTAGAGLLAVLGWSLAFLTGMKPPRCNDARTLIQAGYRLAEVLAPASPPQLVRIETIGGGKFAIRFICSAQFANPDRISLPDGRVIREVQFTSRLAGPHDVPQVGIRLEPVPDFEKVR